MEWTYNRRDNDFSDTMLSNQKSSAMHSQVTSFWIIV